MTRHVNTIWRPNTMTEHRNTMVKIIASTTTITENDGGAWRGTYTEQKQRQQKQCKWVQHEKQAKSWIHFGRLNNQQGNTGHEVAWSKNRLSVQLTEKSTTRTRNKALTANGRLTGSQPKLQQPVTTGDEDGDAGDSGSYSDCDERQ